MIGCICIIFLLVLVVVIEVVVNKAMQPLVKKVNLNSNQEPFSCRILENVSEILNSGGEELLHDSTLRGWHVFAVTCSRGSLQLLWVRCTCKGTGACPRRPRSPCAVCWWCGSWPQPDLCPTFSGGTGHHSWSGRGPWGSRDPQGSLLPDAPSLWSAWHHLGNQRKDQV